MSIIINLNCYGSGHTHIYANQPAYCQDKGERDAFEAVSPSCTDATPLLLTAAEL